MMKSAYRISMSYINSNIVACTQHKQVLSTQITLPFTTDHQQATAAVSQNKRSWKAIRFHLLSRTSEQTRLATARRHSATVDAYHWSNSTGRQYRKTAGKLLRHQWLSLSY